MSANYKSGFTVIETMLFLAVTGVLVVAILAGTGTSINIQRYRDSITSLQSVLQDQYSEVINVRNEVAGQSLICDADANITTGVGLARGQAECVLLGRLITTADDNKTLKMSAVVGHISPTAPLDSSDLATLKNYKLNILPISSQDYAIEWGSSLVQPGGNNPLAFSILILRSPSSGVVRTFIDSRRAVASGEIVTLVEASNLTQSLKACVDAGGLFGANKMAVGLTANATSASGVEVFGEGNSGC
ncbi:hypothetical protein H7X68_03725 [Candidatus Saccharibacteria bacterium]|nr:hypothetical protein [Candidatus Saccharibacteria bacterium]